MQFFARMRTSSVTSQSSLLAILLLLLTIAACFVRQHFAPYAAEIAESEFMPHWGEALLASLLFATSGIVIGRTATKMGAFNGFCTLPISLYGLIACGIFLAPRALTAASASCLTAIGSMLLLRSLNRFGDKNSVFFAAMLFGVATIVYAPCAVLIILLGVAMVLFPLNVRQSIIAVCGWLIPIFAASYVTWYAGGEFGCVVTNIIDTFISIDPHPALQPFPVMATIIAGVIIIVVITAIMLFRANRYSVLVRVRKAMQFNEWLFVILLATTVFTGNVVMMLPVLALPAAVLTAFAFDKMSSRATALLYWLLWACFIAHLFVA